MTAPTPPTRNPIMRTLTPLTLIAALAAALVAALAAGGPAGACAATRDDPCLHDPDSVVFQGTVYLDRDGQGGPRTSEDPAMSRARVFLDIDSDGRRDEREPQIDVDNAGRYALDVDREILDAQSAPPVVRLQYVNGRCTFPDPCTHGEPVTNERVQDDRDFGVAIPAHLYGRVYDDRNENQRPDGRDGRGFGTIGSKVFLDLDEDGKIGAGEPWSWVDQFSGWSIKVPEQLLGRPMNIRLSDEQGVACIRAKVCEERLPALRSGDVKNVGDWAVSVPVIVFVHGFLGSRIACGGDEVWVDEGLRGALPDLDEMRLGPDGRSGLTRAQGGSSCSERARPNGELVMDVAGGDIYGGSVDAFRKLAKADRFAAIAWDWRKDPRLAVEQLDKLIDDLRCGGWFNCDPGRADKVILVAHSQGGLLSRAYISDPARAAKVRRLVTAGTPTLGSPKPILPIAAGIETPAFGQGAEMDLLLDNDETKRFYENLPGGFALLPSRAYGPWLEVPQWQRGEMAIDDATRFLGAINVNEPLVREQTQAHDDLYDHYSQLNGVDYQVVVGTGVPTVQSVELRYGIFDSIGLAFGPGDKTVPEKSARFDAPEDKTHVVCGIAHVPLTGDIQTTSMVDDWVQTGRPVKPNPRGDAPCPTEGAVIEVYDSDVIRFGLKRPAGWAAKSGIRVKARAASGSANGMSLEAADDRGLVDVIDNGAQKFIVADADSPVKVQLPSSGAMTVTTRTIDGTKQGPERTFQPAKGVVDIAAGAGAKVTQKGKALKPAPRDTAAPVTTAKVTRLSGGRVRIALRAKDASKLAGTFLKRGTKRVRYRKSVVLTRKVAAKTTFGSVDIWGNAELPRRLRLPKR